MCKAHLVQPDRFLSKNKRFKTKTLLPLTLALSLSYPVVSFAADETVMEKQGYAIDAGELGQSISRVAVEAGLAISFDPSLTEGLISSAVTGEYTPVEALRVMLSNSGLELIKRQNGSYTLVKQQAKNNQQTKSSTSASEPVSLAAITVEGEKFDRSLQDTLSSVAVITEEQVSENQDRSLTDVMMRTPGVYSQTGSDAWGIRGVPVSGFDDQGPVTVNGTVSVYQDGVIQPHRLVTNNSLPLWDTQQIEIFRGPQSTVQGRNSLIGSVIVRSNDPSYEPEAAIQVNSGNYGQHGISLLAGGALFEDKVAGRVTLDYQDMDGHIDNETLDKDAFAQRNFNARGKLLIQPNDDLDVLLTVARSEHTRGENAVAANGGNPDYYNLFYDTDAGSSVDLNSFHAKVDYYIDDNWSFTSETSASGTKYHSLIDLDQTPFVNQEYERKHDEKAYNQEFRLAYDSDDVRAHVGLYLNKVKLDTFDQGRLGSLVALESEGDTDITTQALFGEINWDFAQDWELIAGLRYDHEKNESDIEYPVDLLSSASEPESKESKSFNAFLPKLGLNYQFAQDQSIGVLFRQGYRAGGVHLRPTARHETYDPEYTNNYELAYRGLWLDKRLRTNVNLYYIDWKDQQVRILDDGGFVRIVNAAESEIYGLEMSAQFDVSAAFTLYMDAAYNHTEYKDFVSDSGDLSGESFLYAPEYKLSLGVTHRYNNKLTTNVNVTYQDDSPSGYITNGDGQLTGERRNDHVTLVNLSASYKLTENLQVSAYVKNLFDEEYITVNQGDDLLDVGAPRLVGISLRTDL